MEKELRTIDLFAGVGGFRIGLEKASSKYKFVWSNQWEPSRKNQFASEIYKRRFGKDNHSNMDIAKVSTSEIPDFDLLVGGFPCQDYSVARTLNQSHGISGKKGVLWWQIYRILNEKIKKPEFIFLENVDRLLKSPAKQRGRDFAIILSSLANLGYFVEWRVINAADYGMPQRRRRVFFLGYHKNSKIGKKMETTTPEKWVLDEGILAKSFKIDENKEEKINSFQINEDLVKVSEEFNKNSKTSPFYNCGIMMDHKVFTTKVYPSHSGKKKSLKDVLLPEELVSEEFFIDANSLDKWRYFKGAKKEMRTNKENGFSYNYAEGSMIFPDALDSPSRTIVTGEGGSSPSRFKHVVKTESGRLRRLTPIELERLNMFPDNHTEGASNTQRSFLMGNALVVGIVERVGKTLASELT